MHLKVKFLLLSGLGLSALSSAQTYSSFNSTTSLTGVTVTPLNSLDYNVTLNSGATMSWNGTKYDVTQIFGFYQLSATDSLGNPTGSDFSGWKFLDKKNGGEIAGWSHDANNGRMNPGDTVEFKYSKITPSDIYGFHFSYTPLGGGTTQTGYFSAPQGAPEPSTFFALGGGVLGILGLRRRRKATA